MSGRGGFSALHFYLEQIGEIDLGKFLQYYRKIFIGKEVENYRLNIAIVKELFSFNLERGGYNENIFVSH